MKAPVKEISIGLLVILAVVSGIVYFYRNIQAVKRTEQIDLYNLVTPEPQTLIRINRPQLAASMIFSQTEIEKIFTSSIPPIYLDLIRESLSASPSILTVDPQGIIFYTKADTEAMKRYRQKVFANYFPSYAPLEEVKNKITYTLFPDTANRFFSYYHHEGILVAGYNLKQLTEVSERQLDTKLNVSETLRSKIAGFDTNAPINLLLPNELFNLHFAINDSSTWHSTEKWLTTDIFTSDGKICYHTLLEAPHKLDSLHFSLAADTLTRQLEEHLPVMIDAQLVREGAFLYFTGCTSNPS